MEKSEYRFNAQSQVVSEIVLLDPIYTPEHGTHRAPAFGIGYSIVKTILIHF
jgi:hypothetical protein